MKKYRQDLLVSIIIPVYNSEIYLPEMLDSLVNQTYKNIEILLCDDKSTDDSYELMLKASKKDTRIKLFQNLHNLGQSRTQNRLIKIAKGSYIAIMNSDDVCRLDRIEKQVSFLNINQDICLLGGKIEINKDGQIFHDYNKKLRTEHSKIIRQLNYITAIDHITLMVRKEVFEQVRYNESLPAAIDYDLLLRAKDKGFKFANLNEVLCTYRIHDDSIGTKHRIKQLKGVYIANKLSKERSQFGREVTQLTADYFDRYQSLGEKYFLLLSNFQRENNIFVAGLRLVISPFSSVGRFLLLRKIKKIIQDRFF